MKRQPSANNTRKDTPSLQGIISKPDNCSKCGLCLSACPVYQVCLTETVSPRGKVQLSKRILEASLGLSPSMKEILSRCLLCGACMTACPSGVQSTQLFSGMRWLATRQIGIDWRKKAIYRILAKKWMLSASARFAALADRHFRRLIMRGAPANIPVAGIPPYNQHPFNQTAPAKAPAIGPTRARVLYFHGCATNYLSGEIGKAVLKVLPRMGVEVETPKGQGCCGIPIILSGARELALESIRDVVETFSRADSNAVIVDCATCGAALRREYVPLLKEMKADGQNVDDALIDAAVRLSEKTRDVMEFVAENHVWLPELPDKRHPVTFTYHDPCHLSKGQGVGPQLRAFFRRLPNVNFVEMPEAEKCCGGGGVFQVDHPEIAAAITSKKIKNIQRTGASILATGCPGCRMTIAAQLGNGSKVRTVHPIQLTADAIDENGL